ncbi:UDP-2,3-diacylglucosamine diphosphatase LpxI [Thalassobius sp. I31.1]|uniref:LpxI family protein n=1 Tax=Thalassobius sp. I31.1 TaxID=2109912 RepID=UPI000D1AD872|nr:UDP-2,3-diacylglucosamine diphosphatase LpxI [Thalassobius sp. I31.1]
MFALIAGQGDLPGLLAKHLTDQGRKPLIAALEGFAPAELDVDLTFRVETLGTFLIELGEAGVTDVCFVGSVARPALGPSKIDANTMPLVPVIMQAMQAGDDGALRAVLDIFEKTGFKMQGAHEILPDLLPPAGIATKTQPTEHHKKDAARGQAIVAAMGVADVGQSCVVARGQAQAIEAQPGTDWMLRSLASDQERVVPGGILYKAPKPNQDRRIDLPVIGLNTVENAAAAGLKGLVLEAGGVMVPGFETVVRACDEAGLFLWLRETDQ